MVLETRESPIYGAEDANGTSQDLFDAICPHGTAQRVLGLDSSGVPFRNIGMDVNSIE